MSAYYDNNGFDDELRGAASIGERASEIVNSTVNGSPEPQYTADSPDGDVTQSTLWNDGPGEESLMNGWNGREETHAMFRQSYE